jgi:hypothetical protein
VHFNAYDRYHGTGLLRSIPNLRVFAYGFGSGFVLLAFAALAMLRGDKRLLSKDTFLLTVIFLYTILFISAFLSTDVPYYYYFSRYNVPYLVIVVIIGGIIINKLHIAWKTTIALVSLAVMIPFSFTLALNRDISGMEIRSQREVMHHVQNFEPGSIIIIEDGLRNFIYLNASFAAESYVFSSWLFLQLSDTSFTQGRDIYHLYITNEDDGTENDTRVASVESTRSALAHWVSGFGSGLRGLVSPHIQTYYVNIDTVDFDSDIKYINMDDTYGWFVRNENRFEVDGDAVFVWSGREMEFHFRFDADEDYLFRLNLLKPPFPEAIDELIIYFKLGLDEDVLYSTIVDFDTVMIEFVIPKEKLEGYNHVLRLLGDTWIPYEVIDSGDARNLGVRITSIEAIPISSIP